MLSLILCTLFYLVVIGFIWATEKRCRRRDIEANYRRAEAIAKRMALIERLETHGRKL